MVAVAPTPPTALPPDAPGELDPALPLTGGARAGGVVGALEVATGGAAATTGATVATMFESSPP
jgi:hypothetical protein